MELDIPRILVGFLAILISITFHEFAHAWMADRLGDDTPRRAGRLTLNPVVIMKAHPFGALVMPLLGAMSGFLVGWASTPVNLSRVRRDVPIRKANLMITAAGPLSNLLLACVSVGLWLGLIAVARQVGQADWLDAFHTLAFALIMANVFLFIFNMLPVPPLDGFQVLRSVLPVRHEGAVAFLSQYSMVLFILIIFAGGPVFRLIATSVLRALHTLAAAIFA